MIVDPFNLPTTSPLIELRMAATEHARRARVFANADDEIGAEREERLADECERQLRQLEAAA